MELGIRAARARYRQAKVGRVKPVVRTPRLDLDDGVPARCHPAGIGVSHLFNGFSIAATPIEAFFIKRLKNVTEGFESDDRPEIASLREDVRAFVSQEANHSATHQKHNRALESMGYPVRRLQRDFFDRLTSEVRDLSDMEAYAMVVAGEHFLGELGNTIVEDLSLTEGMEPRVRAMMLWHFYEEIEHKAVAYDAYEARFGRNLRSYSARVRMYLRATRFMMVNQPRLIRELMKSDGSFGPRELARILWFITFGSGAGFKVAKAYLIFFSPYFHPWAFKDNTHLLSELRDAVIDQTWETHADRDAVRILDDDIS